MAHWKRHLRQDLPTGATLEPVGESWEFSSDPRMPSGFRDYAGTLVEALERWPREILGLSHYAEGCRLLVKLISAGMPLSFQLHPKDSDPALKTGECGKPESWFILHSEPGAGIYLGFKAGTSLEQITRLLNEGAELLEVMQFVPVKPGDFYDIPPHVPHAIGSGVTLLEPQRIMPGLSGKTFRMWDWGRRYDKSGHLSPISGQGRELHVDACLRLIDPSSQSGQGFVNSLFQQPKSLLTLDELSVFTVGANHFYRLLKVVKGVGKSSLVEISVPEGYAVIFLSQGSISWSESPEESCRAGETLLLPNAASQIKFSGFRLSPDFCEMIVMLQGTDQLRIQGHLV
jgi:mannose-6-phosphate isomerase class I